MNYPAILQGTIGILTLTLLTIACLTHFFGIKFKRKDGSVLDPIACLIIGFSLLPAFFFSVGADFQGLLMLVIIIYYSKRFFSTLKKNAASTGSFLYVKKVEQNYE